MKFRKSIMAIMAGAMLTGAAFADNSVILSEEQKQTVGNGLNDFATTLLVVVPQAATQQNVWSDAYIGLVFPSMPFHLGGGITFGGTQLNMTGFKTAATTLCSDFNALSEATTTTEAYINGLGDSVPDTIKDILKTNVKNMGTLGFNNIPDTFFLPTMSLDLRIGGVYLPFDIGFNAMMTNPSFVGFDFNNPASVLNMSRNWDFTWANFQGSIDYLTLGADLRYCVYQGNVVLPKISVGGGYIYSKGGVGASTTSTQTVENVGINTTTARMNITYKTQTMYAQAQVSKDLSFVTLFGGVRGVVSASTDIWAYDYSTTNDGSLLAEGTTDEQKAAVIAALTDSDNGTGTVTSGNGSDGKVYENVYKGEGKMDFSGVQPQLYGGIGFNFACCQTNLGVCWDVRNMLWSGLVNFRIKM